MNAFDENLHFDRLVDGELSEEERRATLTALDSEPGGWRRCALAFLEAQCWRQSFGAIAMDGKETKTAPTVGPAVPRRAQSPSWRRAATAAAMAASFLAALWLGSLAQRVWVTRPNVGSGPGNQVAADATAAAPTGRREADPWRIVNVSSRGRGAQPDFSLNVPAVEREGVDERWLQNAPSAIPENVAQALARTGHDVSRRREFVPVSLEDGRRLVMPVDQVNIHYVGNQTY